MGKLWYHKRAFVSYTQLREKESLVADQNPSLSVDGQTARQGRLGKALLPANTPVVEIESAEPRRGHAVLARTPGVVSIAQLGALLRAHVEPATGDPVVLVSRALQQAGVASCPSRRLRLRPRIRLRARRSRLLLRRCVRRRPFAIPSARGASDPRTRSGGRGVCARRPRSNSAPRRGRSYRLPGGGGPHPRTVEA